MIDQAASIPSTKYIRIRIAMNFILTVFRTYLAEWIPGAPGIPGFSYLVPFCRWSVGGAAPPSRI
jgi:hypothetical protein